MEDPVTVSGIKRTFLANTVQHHLYFRQHGSDLYMFSVSTRGQATVYNIIFSYSGAHPIEVMGEGRSLPYENGGIVDTVTTSKTSHVYRIRDFYTTATRDLRKAITIPEDITFFQVWTSPAGDITAVYDLGRKTAVSLQLYDATGKAAGSIFHQIPGRGIYRDRFKGSSLNPGVYTAVLKAGSLTRVEQVVVIK
jgi:hypothetical protein